MTKKQRWQVVAVCTTALAAGVLLYGQLWLMKHLSWTHQEEPADSLIGINFSCDQAEYLLLEEPGGPFVSDDRPDRAAWCATTLGRILDFTRARSVRLSVQWDEIEPREGEFDFSLTEALVQSAWTHGATVSLSVGMKAQRHPEYYIPAWALEGADASPGDIISDDPLLRGRALAMIAAVVGHFSQFEAIDSWGAENEPYIASHRSEQYSLSREYTALVVQTIRANDPQARPVAINQAQHFVMDRRWRHALADADVLAQSMYPRRNVSFLWFEGVVDIMDIGPLMPNYAYQAREAAEAGKQFWVTELQGEPWTDGDSRLITPDNPSANLSPTEFAENIVYARQTGAQRVYLWGSEWWLFQAEKFDDQRWLDVARAASP